MRDIIKRHELSLQLDYALHNCLTHERCPECGWSSRKHRPMAAWCRSDCDHYRHDGVHHVRQPCDRLWRVECFREFVDAVSMEELDEQLISMESRLRNPSHLCDALQDCALVRCLEEVIEDFGKLLSETQNWGIRDTFFAERVCDLDDTRDLEGLQWLAIS